LFFEFLDVAGPGGLDFVGAHALFDHAADVAAADEFLKERGEKFVADVEVAVCVDEIAEVDACGDDSLTVGGAEVDAVAEIVELGRILGARRRCGA